MQVAFVSGGRARPIPKPLRIAMKADQEAGGGARRRVIIVASCRNYLSHLFETAIGACAIVWSARGIAGVQLPEKR